MNKKNLLPRKDLQYRLYHYCRRTLIVNFETMCSCGGGGSGGASSTSVNTKSKLFCIVFTFNLLLVLLLIPEQIMGKVMSSEKGEMSSAQTSDSAEDEAPDPTSHAYMDDDVVRFVTDDDFVYDDEINHHHNDHFQQNLRGGNLRISLQQEKCPPLPEPHAVVNSRLCEAKICQTDEDCGRDDSVVCCYNGCIHSCLPKVNPPVAFDWIEETELKHFSEEVDSEDSSPTLLAAAHRPETVSLPGGCQLESEQYEDLITFRKLNHVKACSCKQGEVLCEVLHQQDSDSPS